MQPASVLASRLSSGNIYGISLHVEHSGEQPAEVLTFHKSLAREITVGRRSSLGRVPPLQDAGRALFRCPVVSRRHARITFTEYGNAYIMDLKSHHGTHILRPGDTVSKSLKPDTPTVLADGDVVTFGKTVGHDDTLVRPITARVILLCGAGPDAEAPLARAPAHVHVHAWHSELPDRHGEPTHANGTSGRYGIYVSSDDSSLSSSSSDVGEDSDVEEISPPPMHERPRLPLLLPRLTQPGGRLQLLRNLLPPLPQCVVDLRSISPDPSRPVREGAGEIEDRTEADGLGRSDAEQPPDLSIPPPAPVDREESPAVVGAWQDIPLDGGAMSSLLSPHMGSHAIEESERAADVRESLNNGVVISIPSAINHDPMEPHISPPIDADAGNDLVAIVAEADNMPLYPMCSPSSSASSSPEPEPGMTLSEIEGHLHLASNDITMLRIHRRQDEARFDQHVLETKERLETLDRRMHELSGRVSNHIVANDLVISEAVARADDMQADIMRVEEQLHANVLARVSESIAVSEGADAVKAMLEEMKTLKATFEQQIMQQIEERMAPWRETAEAVRVQAEAAASALAEVVKQQQASMQQAAMSSSRKRKRDAMEAEDSASACVDMVPPAPVEPLPKRRRARHIMTTVAQTATVATMGAIAAWTALAFS